MKIGFLTSGDPRSRKSFSGSHYSMLHALIEANMEILVLGPFPYQNLLHKLFSILDKITLRILKKRILWNSSPIVSQLYNLYFSRVIKSKKIDLIFAPAASTSIAKLKTKIPIIYASDATFDSLIGYYPALNDLFEFSKISADKIDSSAIHRSAAITYSSEWAKQSAIKHYGANPSRIFVIPYGANIETAPPASISQRRALAPKAATIQLLFLGVNWERKGGDIALETLQIMINSGIDCNLTVIGCIPPITHDKMEIHPRLDKGIPEQRALFESIFENAHFMIVPTRADCTPVAFCEAAAYGLPVITTNTGGVSSVVINGETGYCLSLEDRGRAYSQIILETWNSPAKYKSMVEASRIRYEQVLNWNAWAKEIKEIMTDTSNSP